MQKKWIIGLGVGALVFVGLYAASPYWAAHKFVAAARDGDADELDRLVDFPSVRERLKSQLNAQMMAAMNNDPEMANNPFAGFGMVMIPAMVEQTVNGFVTPDGIAAMVKSGKANLRNEAVSATPPEYDYRYAGIDRFDVNLNPRDNPDEKATLVFERQGLFSWRVVRFELPESIFE